MRSVRVAASGCDVDLCAGEVARSIVSEPQPATAMLKVSTIAERTDFRAAAEPVMTLPSAGPPSADVRHVGHLHVLDHTTWFR